jgi:hypothetical protein
LTDAPAGTAKKEEPMNERSKNISRRIEVPGRYAVAIECAGDLKEMERYPFTC